MEHEASSNSCHYPPQRRLPESAATLPEAEERTEGTGGLAAFFLGDPQRRGDIQVTGERRAHRGHRGSTTAGDVSLGPSGRGVQALEPGGRRVQARRAEVPV